MAGQTTPKTMSSRLLTMKFMQRAAASPSSAPSTPNSEEQSSKRQKTSHSVTPQQDVNSLVNQRAVQAAIAEEERKRQEALLQHAAELGDARWELDIPPKAQNPQHARPLNVVQVGFAQIDSPDAAGDDSDSTDVAQVKPQALQRWNMGKKEVPRRDESESDESSSDSDSDSNASSPEYGSGRQAYGQSPHMSSPASQSPSRKVLQGKKNAERAKAMQFAEKRRKKEVKLNTAKSGLSSISSGGNSSRPVIFTCRRCGKPGHKAIDCKGASKPIGH
ncbi:hypothetical protein F5X96DRAFT_377550 [Biscogniauxia mediterranea]|nr:hypothetical protein F5X96DRAFT_377550 [Biscogniauxia mediterranea]